MSNKIETNLYDLNKTMVNNLPNFNREVAIEKIRGYFMEQYQLDRLHEHYMLLAAERRDFTVFRFEGMELKIEKMAREIVELLEDRGQIKDVTVNEDFTVDIWVNDVFYKLFDYDWGVIEV